MARYEFTTEDRRKGFRNAVESIERRFPGADGHFLMCAKIGSKPLHKFMLEQIKCGIIKPDMTDDDVLRTFGTLS